MAREKLGYRTRKRKSWISPESCKRLQERRGLKQKLFDVGRTQARLQEEYRKKDLQVKRSMRKDKREWAKNIAQEAENGAKHEQMKAVYEATRGLSASLLRELT